MQLFRTLLRKINSRSVQRLWGSAGGAASVIFSLSLVILIGSMALMIDVARVFAAKSHLANLSEATALTVARNLNFLTREELEDLVSIMTSSALRNSSVFTFNGQPFATTTIVDTEPLSGRASVTINATVPTTILRLLNFTADMKITTTVTAYQFAPDAEIVIVLEGSNEMEQSGKLIEARVAVNEFIAVFDNHRIKDTGAVFGFLPFGSELVNIAPHTDWLEEGAWPIEIPPKVPGTTDWVGDLADDRWCTTKRSGVAGTVDLTPVQARFLLVLEISKTETSEGVPHYTNITSANCRPEQIAPIAENSETIGEAVSSLRANGDVYIGRAMIWSERLLSPDWQPFWKTPIGRPTEYDDETIQKVIILVVGSANTTPDTENILFSETCDRLKSNNVTVYVVDFLAPESVTSLLTNCATTKGHYFRAENDASVSEALYAIAKFLTVVRFSG